MSHIDPKKICQQLGVDSRDATACAQEIAWITRDRGAQKQCATAAAPIDCAAKIVRSHYQTIAAKKSSPSQRRWSRLRFHDAAPIARAGAPIADCKARRDTNAAVEPRTTVTTEIPDKQQLQYPSVPSNAAPDFWK